MRKRQWLRKLIINSKTKGALAPFYKGESMSLVTPDFAEVADEVTPGTYKGIVKKGEVKEWQTGTKYINWEIETYGESDTKNNGRRIFHKTPITGKGAFQLQRFYRAATGKSVTGAFDTEDVVGKSVEITVVDGVNRQTGEPTGYIEVKSVKPASEAPGPEVPRF